MAPLGARTELLADFARELRLFRVRAGQPSYATIQRLQPQLRTSTISDVLAGRTAPSLDFVLAFVRACSRAATTPLPQVADAEKEWRSRWLALQRDLGNVRRGGAPQNGAASLPPRQLPADGRIWSVARPSSPSWTDSCRTAARRPRSSGLVAG